MKKFIIALAAVGALMRPAAAADMAVRAAPPPPPPVYNWTGFWISGGFGYGLLDVDHSVIDPATGAAFDIGHDNGGRGWLGKVGGGFDYEFAGPFLGNWLVGAFADYEWNGIRGNYSVNCPLTCAGPFGGFVGSLKNDYTWAVGGRLGWVVVPQLLTYVNGGWTQGHFKQVDFVDAATGAATGLALAANTQNGWFLGGGTEYAFNLIPGLFWKSEYRFADFGERTASNICLNTAAGTCGATTLHSIDNSHAFVQTITTELVYRFNWGGPAGARY
jgi:outer membrane immunogenic protein